MGSGGNSGGNGNGRDSGTLRALLVTLILASFTFTALLTWRVMDMSDRISHLENQYEWATTEMLRITQALDRLSGRSGSSSTRPPQNSP